MDSSILKPQAPMRSVAALLRQDRLVPYLGPGRARAAPYR